MMCAIQIPVWLINFWGVYGDVITPVLVTLLVSLLTYVALKLRSDGKVNAAKADLQIEALREVANKKDTTPQLEEQNEKISDLEKAICYLADMFNVAFQSSSLDPEIKNNLQSLVNKLKYGSEKELIKDLEDNNKKLQEQLTELSNKMVTPVINTVTEKIIKRTRR